MSAPKGIALNIGGLNTAVGYEYQRNVETPKVTGVLRGSLPSYAKSFLHTTQAETITLTVPIGSIDSMKSAAVAGQQSFQELFSVALANSDVGQIMFNNISVTPSDPSYIVSHPQFLLQNGSGQNVNGAQGGGILSPGTGYQGLNVQANTTVFNSSSGTIASGTLTIRVTACLLGTVNQGIQQQQQ